MGRIPGSPTPDGRTPGQTTATSVVFDQWYRGYRDVVFAFLFHFCHNHHEAEDLLQETFLRAFRALEAGEEIREPRHWLVRVAYRIATDRWRRSRLLRWVGLTQLAREPEATSSDGDVAEREAIHTALRQLPHDQRACLVLREQEGMSYDEIASTLGLSLGAVKMKLMRARERFRLQYTTESDDTRQKGGSV